MLAGARLRDFAGSADVDDFFVGIDAGFAADAGKGRPDTVVIVLRPALEGMVVALGALDANSQEQLGGRFGGILRVAAGASSWRRGFSNTLPRAVNSSRANWSSGLSCEMLS